MIKVPEIVLTNLCQQLNIDRHSLVYLGGGREDSDGIAYTYSHSRGQRVLKVMAFPVQDEIGLLPYLERLKFVHFLGDQGVDIVYPIPARNGDLFITCQNDEHTFFAYIMNKVDGVHVQNEIYIEEFAERYGKLIGKLHSVSKLYPTWQHSLVDGRQIMGWEQEWQSFYDWCSDSQVKKCWLSICTRLEKLPISRDTFGFIHNDPHIKNLLVCQSRLVLLDFDVANYHWFINDIAITLQPILFSRAGGMNYPVADTGPLIKFLVSFVRGYRTENDLPDFWLEQIDLFISYRRLLLFTVMQGWMAKNPRMRSSWKKMILSEPRIFL